MKIGLVGCGHWGRFILRDLRILGCEVFVVARSGSSVLRAREGGAAGIAGGIAELPAVEGLVVATPTTTHAAVLPGALALGVPVFVEKPLTVDGRSATRLASAEPERLFVMDKWRYHPGVEALRDVLRSGELGPLRGLRTWRIGNDDRKSDTDVIWHLLPHDLAIAFEILGKYPEPVRAVAAIREEPVDITVLFRDGVEAHVSNVAPSRKRQVRLFCEDGTATLGNPYDASVEIRRRGYSSEYRAIGTEFPLRRELAAFVAHLAGGPPPRTSAADGAEAVLVIERIRELAGLA